MSDIFISYAKEDRPHAEIIARALVAHGWSVWWDRELRAGGNIAAVIDRELGQARCVLVLWSAVSVKRDWVHDEAREGQERGVLIPVLIEDVRQPLGFRSMKAADLAGWERDTRSAAFEHLRGDIEALIGAPARPRASPAAGIEPQPAKAPPRPGTGRKARWTFDKRWVLGGVATLAMVLAIVVVSRQGWIRGNTPERHPVGKGQPASLATKLPATQPQPGNKPETHPGGDGTGDGSGTPVLGRNWTNRKDGLSYVWIQPGEFWMGAVPGDTDADSDEKPRHRVKITKGFWIGATPVNVAAYQRFVSERTTFKMPEAPSFNPNWANQDHPVVRPTWSEAQAYCEWAGGTAGRLPYEAEWEYAARGGAEGQKYPWGNEITPKNANYSGGKWHGTTPVRSYPSNGFDLNDMGGNVWNWAADRYDRDYYATFHRERTVNDPHGPSRETGFRVLRGGSFVNDAGIVRASARTGDMPDKRDDDVGFRCVREVIP